MNIRIAAERAPAPPNAPSDGAPRLPLRRLRQRAGGYTLAEMAVSSAVMSVIVVALGSSVTLLLREGENNRNLMASGSQGAASASAQAATAREALDILNADLRVATAILATPLGGGGLRLELTAPGRSSGNTSETLVYQWTGPGASLTRQVNSSPAASIADNVQSLNLATIAKTVGPAPPAGNGTP